ncbi:MAG: photosynthetic complex putative assembly protein PuhB [Sphingomonadaceae bacterium]|nr:photosynthetic complex putative assembly protein PuhB [Sphingomonadaceae bacterium]
MSDTRILWRGKPDARLLARSAFHTRTLSFYFAGLALLALAVGQPVGAAVLAVLGTFCVGLLSLIAWGMAREADYVLTSQRLVMRIGLAVPVTVNIPLKDIGAADIHPLGRGAGDIALTPTDGTKLAYFLLWPHARPWKLARPRPMMRALPDVATAAAALARACGEVVPIARTPGDHAPAAAPAPVPVPAHAPATSGVRTGELVGGLA